ncbi:MarR family winged helix-turn-helix transcriptional regulator [Cryobacterium sp. TMT4-31]|uniref:MarR family winged helix-turn-helix transcriptional regulator n=1 Tax=Cryobacterium sp. TMT4-31 TaxID=1259259 RepID=UPI0010699BB3|nr:MarR family transcriptional regulator [Cryobacterium sp. TMT4-31]TFC91131.1 MarR family transcriptional regulator [Cryobacterium sp. TMT4-31]
MTQNPRWLTDDQQQLWQDLLTVVIALPTLLDRQLTRDSGLSNFEYSVLARLSMSDERTIRLSELAAACNCTLPRLSKVMARFEQHAWVTRRPDPENGRFTLGTLTDLGMEKVVDSAPGHVERVRQLVFDPLTRAQQLALRTPLAVAAQEIRSLLSDDEAVQTESSKSSARSR